jgi:hypothetical protein
MLQLGHITRVDGRHGVTKTGVERSGVVRHDTESYAVTPLELNWRRTMTAEARPQRAPAVVLPFGTTFNPTVDNLRVTRYVQPYG